MEQTTPATRIFSWSGSQALKSALMICLFLFPYHEIYAQNCSTNAGVDVTLCNENNTLLAGSIAGVFDSNSINWVQISGPASVINSPNSLTPSITNLIPGNTYEFELSATCDVGGTVSDIMEIEIEVAPAFTAGPDLIFCMLNIPSMNATLPPGYIGFWETNNEYVTFADSTSPVTAISIGSDCFGSATLTWTVSNGICSFSDDVTINGQPDPTQEAISTLSQTFCGTEASASINCSPNNYNITITPISEPTPATTGTYSFGGNAGGGGSITVDDMTVPGTYTYDINIASNYCPGSSNFTIDLTSLTPTGLNASFTTSANSLQQLNYSPSFIGSGYMFLSYHCGASFTTLQDTIWLYATAPTPSSATNSWSSSSSYTIDNPNIDSTFAVYNGNVVNTPGEIWFYRNVNNGSCSATRYGRFTLYGDPPTVSAPDTLICSGATMQIGLAEGLSPVHALYSTTAYATYISPSYLTQIAGPNVNVNYVSSNTSNLYNDHFEFQGLLPGNTYTFVFGFPDTYTNWGPNSIAYNIYPYLNCGYTGPLRDTFDIVYPGPIGLSTGTSQTLQCDSTNTALAGAVGLNQSGTWSFASGPTNPIVASPNSITTGISGMDSIGTYIYHWTVTNQCATRIDSVFVQIPDCTFLGVELTEIESECDGVPVISWATSSERDNEKFTIFRSIDGVSFTEIATIQGAGNSSVPSYYKYTDASYQELSHFGPIYYSIIQEDFDGEATNLGVFSTECKADEPLTYFDNQGTLIVEYNKAFDYSVYEANGKLVQSGSSYDINQSQSNYATGIYMIQISTALGEIFTQKKLCIAQ